MRSISQHEPECRTPKIAIERSLDAIGCWTSPPCGNPAGSVAVMRIVFGLEAQRVAGGVDDAVSLDGPGAGRGA